MSSGRPLTPQEAEKLTLAGLEYREALLELLIESYPGIEGDGLTAGLVDLALTNFSTGQVLGEQISAYAVARGIGIACAQITASLEIGAKLGFMMALSAGMNEGQAELAKAWEAKGSA